MKPATAPWHLVENLEDVPSPALLVYPGRVEANLRKMIAIAGDPRRLWPHVKTHKLRELVRLQQRMGITHFKCATVAEAEMLAGCGAQQVLLAHQPVGPGVRRLLELIRAFPATHFATLVDCAPAAHAIAQAAQAQRTEVTLLVDLDCGMGRTGIAPSPEAAELYRLILRLPGIANGGLHAYDGQIHDRDPALRKAAAREAFAPVAKLRQQLLAEGLPVPRTVAGGTPTFPFHAHDREVECSPGTSVLWDAGYAAGLPDLPFEPAALLITRVVSRPRQNRLCLDLGHKAVAAESPPPRVELFGLPEAVPVIHDEEHLVVETPRAGTYAVGDLIYGLPRHICPTVALHAQVVVIESGHAVARWNVLRDRMLTI